MELSHLYNAFAPCSSLESVSLKATFVLSQLVLQRPRRKSSDAENRILLEKRLKQWEEGDFEELLNEGTCRAIQSYLKKCSPKRRGKPSLSHSLANLIFNGRVTEAIQLLSTRKQGRLLSLNPF